MLKRIYSLKGLEYSAYTMAEVSLFGKGKDTFFAQLPIDLIKGKLEMAQENAYIPFEPSQHELQTTSRWPGPAQCA